MDSIITFILAGLQITLLDIVLSGDNVGVIALAIRNLDPKQAKTASIIGVTGAIVMRVLFASVITVIMGVGWLPIKLIGGLLLLKITWNLMKEEVGEEGENGHAVKSSGNMWKAVTSIIIADVSMSLDNVLAVGGAAHGNIGLIVFGIALNIPIIFFGSQLVANLMKKYKITIYVGAAILMHTAVAMIFEDHLVQPYLSHAITASVPWALAFVILLYGFIKTNALTQIRASIKASRDIKTNVAEVHEDI